MVGGMMAETGKCNSLPVSMSVNAALLRVDRVCFACCFKSALKSVSVQLWLML
jgi:hypothetical protein